MKDGWLEDPWVWAVRICEYFYENRSFYSKALKITSQNSLSDHFKAVLSPIIYRRFEDLLEQV